MYKLVDIVADIMEPYYPNVKDKSNFIKRVIKSEEERFHETLEEGLTILNELIKEAKNSDQVIKGHDAFKLYDTYGFPIELTEELATQENLSVDMPTFEQEMQQQRDRARQARQNSQSMQVQSEVLKNIQGELAPTIEFARPGGIMEEGRMFLNDAKENVDKLNRGRATRRMPPIQQSRQLVEILQYEGDFYLAAGETYLFYVYWDTEWNKGLIMGYQYGSLRLEDEQQPAEELTKRNRRAIGKTWNVVNESTKETTNLTTYLKDELGIELPAE